MQGFTCTVFRGWPTFCIQTMYANSARSEKSHSPRSSCALARWCCQGSSCSRMSGLWYRSHSASQPIGEDYSLLWGTRQVQDLLRGPDERTNFCVFVQEWVLGKTSLVLEPVPQKNRGYGFWGPDSFLCTALINPKAIMSGVSCVPFAYIFSLCSLLTLVDFSLQLV